VGPVAKTVDAAVSANATRKSGSRRKQQAVTCQDCFFMRHRLCALALDSPCPTFRPDSPDGLVPPRQPELLMRQPEAGGDGFAQAA
jgi:hypothetical protein